MWNKKLNVLMVCILLVMIFLSACQSSDNSSKPKNESGNNKVPSADSAEPPKEPVEISWYLGTQTPEEKKIVDEQINTFQASHPEIKIKVTYQENPDVLTKQQLAAGGGPDIVQTDGPTTLKELSAAGYLLPLDQYAQKFGWEQKFYPWALNSVKYEGHVMGYPGAYEALLVYYNKDMFEKNGWSVPTSYQELVDLCAKIKAKKIIPFAFGTAGYKAINEWWLSIAYNSTLGAEEFKKVLTGEVPWNSDLMEEATQKLVDMWQKGYINEKKTAAITADNAGTLFNSGKAAMIMEGTWALSNHVENAKFNWGMYQMPAWRDGVQPNFPLGLGDATGINKKSKHPDEVAEFLDYLNNPDEAKKSLVRGAFRPINGVDISSITDIDPHVRDAYEMLNKAMQNNQTGYVSWTYWPPSASTYAWGNIETVYYNQTNIKTYLKNVATEFDKDKAGNKLFDFGN